MEILVLSATANEIQPTFDHCSQYWVPGSDNSFTLGQVTVDFVITGPGLVRMAYALGQILALRQPDLCINAGIAGAFPGKFEIGEVVHVTEEIMGDLGAEDRDGSFLALQDMKLEEDIPSSLLINQHAGKFSFLPAARGVTVNTTSGTSETISKLVARYDPDVESMEGAAFFYGCLKKGVQFISLRAISNLIEPRDKARWQIPLAVGNLNMQLIEMLNLLRR